MDVFNHSFWKLYIKTINELDPGLNLPEHLSELPHLPGVPHLHINRPLDCKQSEFCVFKYARAVKQKVWKEAEKQRAKLGRDAKNVHCAKVL